MGNSQSHSQRHLHTTSHPPVSIVSVTPHKVTLNKKKSRMQLATKLSCISGWSSQESLPSTTTSTSASDEKRCLSEDSLSSPHERDDATVPEHPNGYSAAYASFLDAYPEYRQTWMLDSLRRSDFSRLMRSGETYVDYMGGSLYPESLVHVHADFLSRSILGNTHSVNNRLELPVLLLITICLRVRFGANEQFPFPVLRCHLRLLQKHVKLFSPSSTLPPVIPSFSPPMQARRLSSSESHIRSVLVAHSSWERTHIIVSMVSERSHCKAAQKYATYVRRDMVASMSRKLRCVVLCHFY